MKGVSLDFINQEINSEWPFASHALGLKVGRTVQSEKDPAGKQSFGWNFGDDRFPDDAAVNRFDDKHRHDRNQDHVSRERKAHSQSKFLKFKYKVHHEIAHGS